MTYQLPKAPPSNTITLNIWLQHMNLGGGRGTQTLSSPGRVGGRTKTCLWGTQPSTRSLLGKAPASLGSRGKTAKGLQGPWSAPNKHQMDMLLSILFSVTTRWEFCMGTLASPPCALWGRSCISVLWPLDRGVRDMCEFGSHSSIFLFANLEPNMVYFMYGSRWALNLIDPISLHIQGRQDSFGGNFSQSCRGTLANSIKFPLPPSQGLALGS